MNYKRKKHKHRIWRKMYKRKNLLKEWSRMLHLWWKRDFEDKLLFKRYEKEK